MVRSAVPIDTDPRTYEILVERWRSMDVAERAGRYGAELADAVYAGLRTSG